MNGDLNVTGQILSGGVDKDISNDKMVGCYNRHPKISDPVNECIPHKLPFVANTLLESIPEDYFIFQVVKKPWKFLDFRDRQGL